MLRSSSYRFVIITPPEPLSISRHGPSPLSSTLALSISLLGSSYSPHLRSPVTNTSICPQPSLKNAASPSCSFNLLCHLSFSLKCPSPNIHPFPLSSPDMAKSKRAPDQYIVCCFFCTSNSRTMGMNSRLWQRPLLWEGFLFLEHGCRDLLPFSLKSILKG